MKITNQQLQDFLKRREYPKAEALIQTWIQREPESADAFYHFGVLYYFQGQPGKAIEALRKALHYESKHTDAAICLSVVLNDIGKYDEAKQVFEKANQSVAHQRSGDDLESNRKFAVKHLELADLYFRYRRHDEAIEEYSKAALLDSTLLDIRIRLAKVYSKKGFVTRALQELQQLKNEHQDFIPARIQLGLLHYSQGNVLDAELEWEGVLQKQPAHREAVAYLEMAKESRLKPLSH
jgi:tetratricopeptide (TPR) repeat protein